MERIPSVCIVGRTNVGKSSLFNAIAGKPIAVVENEHGVTRDRNYTFVTKHGFPFTLIDTGGIVGDDGNILSADVRTQTELAMAEADLVLAVVDAQHGLSPLDAEVAIVVRHCQKPVVWLANKCESERARQQVPEFYQLGIEELLAVSAVHRQGMKEIVNSIKNHIAPQSEEERELGLEPLPEELPSEEKIAEDLKRPIKIAVVGKPNVGKSTFTNRLLGEDRMVTSDQPGTTRDSISAPLSFEGQEFVLVDTAGLRRKARVEEGSTEQHSNFRTVRALSQCDVAVLLLDAKEGIPAEQDMKVAELIHERGRSFIIVVNKWDLIEKDHTIARAYEEAIEQIFDFARYAPVFFVSAKTGRGCVKVLKKAQELFVAARARIQTADLNRILARAFMANPPQAYHGQPVKMFFATQVGVAPPTIVLFSNFPRKIGGAYQRYLKNTVRKHFPFPGVDIKFVMKKRTEKAERSGSVSKQYRGGLDARAADGENDEASSG